MNRSSLIAGISVLSALLAAPATGGAQSRAERNEAAVLRLIEVWHNGDLDLVDELIAASYTIKHDAGSPWDGRVLSREQYKRRVESYPGYRFEVIDLLAGESSVALSFRMLIPGAPKTASRDAVPARETTGMTMYYFDSDGLINGHWQVIAR